MSDKDNGGPAFPEVPGENNSYDGKAGMSLRDYFAAKALQGLLAMQANPRLAGGSDAEYAAYYEHAQAELMAVDAYFLADAMLEARNK